MLNYMLDLTEEGIRRDIGGNQPKWRKEIKK